MENCMIELGIDQYIDLSPIAKWEEKNSRYNIFLPIKKEIPEQFLIDIIIRENIFSIYTLKKGMILQNIYTKSYYMLVTKITDKRVYFLEIDTMRLDISELYINKSENDVGTVKIAPKKSERSIIKKIFA